MRRAADGKIVQPLLDEGDDFVALRLRLDEIGLLVVELEQALGERRELEKVILLGDRFRGPAAIRARIAGLGLVHVQLVENAVLAGVTALVHVAVLHAALKEPLHGFAMSLVFGRADEVVDAQTEVAPLSLKLLGDGLRELLWRLPRCVRGALHFLTVLVGSRRQHHRVVALHALEALDHIGGDGGIGVADVRGCVDVVDGCGQVVFHRWFFEYAKFASAMMSLRAMPVERASVRQSSYSGAKDRSETFIRTLP